ncbi:ring canal kelch homolog isoform X2 [Acyrthosiphon pisum]|uniref:Kelch-like protein diablo n=1 Tax=Acyrthosiphon pisum TaxID=7029 RepID=A0A8R2H6W0_ACYPI|nr:ring canal kelch homolog isoform X2 [Acyrthosiphon pisum]|eukprot:XP_016658623.1 PREDICTED: ring canal kelch homolog isoform X2 [Acyrthosiphon pisum]
MDENNLQHLTYEGDQTSVLKFKRGESKKIKNSIHTEDLFWHLQRLLIDKAFCDVKLETDDGTVVHGHKLILISASPYFRAMFSSFEERNKDHIVIKGLNSTSLKLLINYIYSGEIIVNEENVKDMLAAADLIQLDYIRAACEEFLQTQLNPSNCLGIRAFADLHNCTDLMSSSDAYIKKQFLEVAKYNEFLRLSPEEVIQLISLSDLDVPKEEYVFESVMNWVRHELGCRKQFLPDLMEHVRLPLTSKPYLLNNVVEEPLLNNCHKCKNYVLEAIQFHTIKSQKIMTIPKTIRSKPRRSVGLQKIGGKNGNISLNSVEVFDVNLEEWRMVSSMAIKRCDVGVGILNNLLYAVGGFDISTSEELNSVECYDPSLDEWKLVAPMSKRRSSFGIGVLDGVIYAVGGADTLEDCNSVSVEAYRPSVGVWTPVADMLSGYKSWPVTTVIDGLMYVIGNTDSIDMLTIQVYNPKTNAWKLMNTTLNDAGLIMAAVTSDRPLCFKTKLHKCSHGW